jgi:L-alanine-DL-glutamate epimerase-like enolase superfamily enzyme
MAMRCPSLENSPRSNIVKITKVEAIPLGYPLDQPLRWGRMVVHVKGGIIVRVHTDVGIIGIGEAGLSAAYFSTVGPVINELLGPALIGQDPLLIDNIWEQIHGMTHMWGRRGVETYAISGIDIALWDILGKVSNQPVYRLLGAHKTKIRAYFAPSLKDVQSIVQECTKGVEAGFTAFKLRVGFDFKQDQEIVRQVRQAVGDQVDLMVDANMAYDRRTALEMAKFLEDQNVFWFEEPIHTKSISQYVQDHKWLNDRVRLKLAGGESLLTRYEFIDVMKDKVFDVIQPDATTVGGISEVRRVADMGSAWNLIFAPHIACSSGTGISLACGLHAALACSSANLLEFDAYGGPAWDGMLQEPICVQDGYLSAPTAPGLGIDLSSDALERFAL